MIKRFANIFLILVVLLITVQPQFVLHFCGDKFVGLYINHDPSLIKSECDKGDHCENRDHCPEKSVAESSDCENRNLITVDLDTDDFTAVSTYTAPLPSDDVLLYLPEIKQFLFAQPAAYLFYGKSPPGDLPLSSGRDILTRNCVYLI